MVKECKVLMNNDSVTVFAFGNIEVQVPSIKREADTVKVIVENGKYKVVADDYKEIEKVPFEKKVKKTTDKELKDDKNEE